MNKVFFRRTFATPEETQQWGKKLGSLLRPGDVVALIGDLGSGKTTLVQGIARGGGYRGAVNSPTFALVNEYASSRGILFHMDMYRLTPPELERFPLEDYLESRGACVIEWADRVAPRLPPDALTIFLHAMTSDTRTIEIVNPAKSWIKRLPGKNR